MQDTTLRISGRNDHNATFGCWCRFTMAFAVPAPGYVTGDQLMVELTSQFAQDNHIFTSQSYRTFSLWCMSQHIACSSDGLDAQALRNAILATLIQLLRPPMPQDENGQIREDAYSRLKRSGDVRSRLSDAFIGYLETNNNLSYFDMASAALEYSFGYLTYTCGNLYVKYRQYNASMLSLDWREGQRLLQGTYWRLVERYRKTYLAKNFYAYFLVETLVLEMQRVVGNMDTGVISQRDYKRTKEAAIVKVSDIVKELGDVVNSENPDAYRCYNWKLIYEPIRYECTTKHQYTLALWQTFPGHCIKLQWLFAQILCLTLDEKDELASKACLELGHYFCNSKNYKAATKYLLCARLLLLRTGRQVTKKKAEIDGLLSDCYNATEVSPPPEEQMLASDPFTPPPDPAPNIGP